MNEKPTEFFTLLRKRLDAAITAYSDSRAQALNDFRFYAGSPENNWQWPESVIAKRSGSANGQSGIERPTLTINMIPGFVLQITNEQRMHRPQGKVIPVDSNADPDMAEKINGILRFIEFQSSAEVAYAQACQHQVIGGEGYIRLATKWKDTNTFDQDILIETIYNPFSVYLDPEHRDICGKDAQWAFITHDMPADSYDEYAKDARFNSQSIQNGVGDGSTTFGYNEGVIRVAEYFWTEKRSTTLLRFSNGDCAEEGTFAAEALFQLQGQPVSARTIEKPEIHHIITNGYEALSEEVVWPGSWIPIIKVTGNEITIDGTRYTYGLVRMMTDAQRMYNYYASEEAEMLALAPKAPFIGYAGQFKGYEHQWRTANTHPWAYLEVNPSVTDSNGAILPLPQRSPAPEAQVGLIQSKLGATDDMKKVTGLYNASLGQHSNERTGKAILARQQQGNIGTFHYIDNLAQSVKFLTQQIVELFPKIIPPKTVLRILGEDGTHSSVSIDTSLPEAVTRIPRPGTDSVLALYNPTVGKYDTTVVVGQSYATRRTEALEGMILVAQANPALWQVAGDLLVQNMDWPGAAELAKRLKRTIPPALLDSSDESPELVQAKQQIAQLQQQLAQMQAIAQGMEQSFDAREVAVKEEEARIKAYDAETRRLKAIQPVQTTS